MRIQKQKYHHDPDNGIYGDCYRTCVAMLLDMDRDSVPHFAQEYHEDPDGPSATQRIRDWLKPKGLCLFSAVVAGVDARSNVLDLDKVLTRLGDYNPYTPFMFIGQSGRYENTAHVVIVRDGKIIADPSGSGISGPIEGVYYVELICLLAEGGLSYDI